MQKHKYKKTIFTQMISSFIWVHVLLITQDKLTTPQNPVIP